MKCISIPASRWEWYYRTISLMALSQQKGDAVVSVQAFAHEGSLYMATGAMHGHIDPEPSASSTIYATRLLPINLYEGETTPRYHDEEAIKAGKRKRGDHTGLIVKANRELMVCCEPVNFAKLLPDTKPIPLSEAQAADRENHGLGWRAFNYRGILPSWRYLQGHPVACYHNPGDDSTYALFWKRGSVIIEERIGGSWTLSEDPSVCTNRSFEFSDEEQLALF
ncbi:hypothetical protein ACMHYO_11480 [Allopusillimonas ginsengisoli]|uniref:hypothetical protein n=1 Tax=Allopusillimonas ginsengisoli TaxID=453575 RepID=UPI0039C382B4